MTLGGELIGVSSNDIFGAEKAANEETTPLDGDAGDAVFDVERGGVPKDVVVVASLEDDEVEEEEESEVEVLSVERAGTVGAVR